MITTLYQEAVQMPKAHRCEFYHFNDPVLCDELGQMLEVRRTGDLFFGYKNTNPEGQKIVAVYLMDSLELETLQIPATQEV